MKAQEWRFIDKRTWRDGPWQQEPDKAQWPDEATGLPCLARRHDNSGHWCGYVGVTEGHPLFGMGDESEKTWGLEVHGGITYGDFCAEDKEHGVCHVPEPGEPDRVWWLGFDCAHAGDMSPGFRRLSNPHDRDGIYRDLAYVKHECAELARQIAEAVV